MFQSPLRFTASGGRYFKQMHDKLVKLKDCSQPEISPMRQVLFTCRLKCSFYSNWMPSLSMLWCLLSVFQGMDCEYRHSEVARLNPRECWYWLAGNCLDPACCFRHPVCPSLIYTIMLLVSAENMLPSHCMVYKWISSFFFPSILKGKARNSLYRNVCTNKIINKSETL